jgi:hypothetical protein
MTDPTPELNAALAALQGELPTFTDDQQRTVTVVHKDGSEHSYKYVTLNTIMELVGPLMAKNGLSFTAMPGYNDPGDGKIGLSLRYRLAHKSGEEIGGIFPLPGGDGSGTQGQRIQAMGSAISYARRYCLGAVLGITAEQDDDGRAAADLEDSTQYPTARRARGQAARTEQAARNTARANQAAAPDGPPPDDAPPTETAARRNPDGPVTMAEQRKIFAQLRDIDEALTAKGDAARAERLAMLGDLLGKPLSSINDLTSREASELIDVLDLAVKSATPRAVFDAAIEAARRDAPAGGTE